MNERHLDEMLDHWLDTGPTVAPQRVSDAARLEAGAARQARPTPAWLPRFTVLVASAAAIVAVAVVVRTVVFPVGDSTTVPQPDVAMPITDVDLEPRPGSIGGAAPAPRGPVVEVARGTVGAQPFSVTVYRPEERDRLCMWVQTGADAGGGCGPLPAKGLPEFGPFGMIGHGPLSNGTILVDGMVAADAEQVWVETNEGRRADALVVPYSLDGLEASAFVVYLPSDTTPTTIVAADGSGAVIAEVPLLPIEDPGDEGPPPTPAR